MSDIWSYVPGASSPAAAPAAPSPATAGGGGDIWSYVPGAKTATAAPAAPKGKGGGGIGGFLGRVASGVKGAVLGAPKGIGGLLSNVGEAGLGAAENVANDVSYAATLGHMGGLNERHLGGAGQTPTNAAGKLSVFPNQAERTAYLNAHPYSGSLIRGPLQTEQEIQHPTKGAHDIVNNPVGTILNTAATLAIVGGPAAHALGAGAEVTGAAGAGDVAARLSEASHAAGRVATAPLLPYAAAARGAGAVLGAVPGVAAAGDLAAEQAGRAAEAVRTSSLGQKIADIREASAAKQTVGTMQAEQERIPIANEGARLHGEGRALTAAVGNNPVEHGAAILNAQGQFDPSVNGELAAERVSNILADQQARAVIDAQLAERNRGLPARFHVTTPMVELAAQERLGLLDSATATRLATLEDFYRGTSDVHQARAVAGFGLRPGDAALSPEQTAGPQPMENVVGPAADEARIAATAAENQLAAARAREGVPTPGHPGFPGSLPPEQANIPKLSLASELMARASGQAENQPLQQLAAEHGLQSAAQIPEYTAQTRAALGQIAERPVLVPAAERAATRATAAVEAARSEAEQSLAAAPSAYRPALTRYTQWTGALADEARAAAKAGDTATAEHLAQVANDLRPYTKLASFQEEGVQQPSHLIGANRGEITRAMQERGAKTSGATRLTKTGQTFARKGNVVGTTVDAHIDSELGRFAQQARNEFVKTIAANLAQPTSSLLGDVTDMNAREMYQAGQDAGYRPWNPKVPGGQVDSASVDANTLWLPKAQFNEIVRQFTPKDPTFLNLVGRGYDKLTRILYKTPLQLSPHYIGLRAVSNAFMLAAHDMNPLEIAQAAPEALRMIREGEAPGALRGGLLDESRQGRVISKLTGVPRFIDQMSKVMLYLHNMGEGADPVTAVRMANEAFYGVDRTGMTTASRVFPIWPWARQIARVAATLGEEHPASVAFILHMGDVASAQKGQPGGILAQLNPVGFIGANPGAFVNPLIRAAAGEVGLNLAAHRDVTRPPGEATGFGKFLGAGQEAHFAENQVLAGKLYNAIRQNPVTRYDTGEPRLGKGVPVGGTPLAGGRLGAVKTGLGLTTYKPPATPSPASVRFTKSQKAAARKYQQRLKAYEATKP